MNFSSVCRTCLGSDTLKPIFTEKNDYKKCSNRIYTATGVKIHYNDKLPKNMCKICLNKINEIHNFRQQCKEVKTKLLKIIEKENEIKSVKNEKKGIEKILIKNNSNEFDDKTSNKLDNDININKHSKIYDKSNNDDLIKLNENTDNIHECKPELTTVLIINRIDENSIKIDNDSDDGINISTDPNERINISTLSNNIGADSDDDKPLKALFDYKNSKLSADKFKKSKLNNENRDYNNKIDDEQKEIKSKEISHLNKRKNNNLKTFSKSESLELPYDLIKDPNNEKVTKVFCKICCKELSIRSIASHMSKRHPGADCRKVKCELCDSYVMADKLNRHNIMMHNGNECFVCRYCKVKFEIKDKLMEHVKECMAKKRKRKVYDSGKELLQCDICNKVMQKASLRMHNAMKHAGLKPVCQHCGISFGNKLRLQEHYRAKHGYEKFKCKYCEFTSAALMAMRNHERRHVGDKPYVCESCGVKFHAAYLLTQHKQSHRTDKNIKCDLCPAAFKANNSLHMHKLTCHSNSTYMCTLCCRSYKCRHYALKHIRHVHRYNGNPLTVVNKQDVVTVNKD